ncbi:CocE/NonD family hydrolase [Actinocorallia aurantiaca]|uniref:CocE/NonD family hydrolase n=1 Tax=Actinocorallia aurantiaca TaxID=46204 RepID=A0ABN3U960_9ACTN
MSTVSRVTERLLGLPPALTRDVEVRRGLAVPMSDGVELAADLYLPRRTPGAPTVLVRSPYGRRGWVALLAGRTFAERGHQVLIQAVRGTERSGGEFDPFGDERRDGLDTLAWLEKEPWFNGRVVTFGPSYLGYAQWALAPDAGDRLSAMAPFVTASQFRDQTYLGGAFTLRGCLSWSAMMARQRSEGPRARVRSLFGGGRLERAFDVLPLNGADTAVLGRAVLWFQEWLEHAEPDDPYWVPERDHRARVAEVTAPVSMVGGWHDLFLASQLEDYRALRDAGRSPQLTVGPWSHTSPGLFGAAVRDALEWFGTSLRGEPRRRAPVRLYVQGAGEWRDYADWPPPATPTAFHLHPGGVLAADEPEDGPPSAFVYDPADPTPGVGGPLLGSGAGPRDQREVEERADVLLFTGEPLAEDLEIVGPVSARVYLRSDAGHTDLLVRLCDVDARGRSVNVCDGLRRLVPDPSAKDGVREVEIELWPTAHRFEAGHRLRVQVASGAHPRFARNTGGGEPLGSAARLVVQRQEVLHGPAHPSAVLLPLAARP